MNQCSFKFNGPIAERIRSKRGNTKLVVLEEIIDEMLFLEDYLHQCEPDERN